MKPEKLYRCPVCHDVLTEQAYEEQMEIGGVGYCYCQFKDGDRILTGYDVYNLSTQDDVIESLATPEEGFKEHCFCNRGLLQTPNKKTYCPVHGYDYQSLQGSVSEK